MDQHKRSNQADQDRWRHAIERAQLGLWDWDLRTGDCFYSDSWFEMLGYKKGELLENADLWLDLAHPEDRDRAVASGERHLSGETGSIETELRLRHKSGSWVWVLDRGGVIEWDPVGRPLRAVGVQTDITAQKTAEAMLAEANTQTRLALEASSMGIWHFDVDTQKSFWDSRTREIFGVGAEHDEHAREFWHAFLHPEDKERTERAHSLPGSSTTPTKVSYRIIRRDGGIRHVETLAKLLEIPGTSGRLVGTIRDTTEEYERQQRLEAAARHDPLTGALNRASFEEAIETLIAGAERRPFAMYYIDLDYFKALNDSMGHAAGDAALQSVAREIRNSLPAATIARLGGDEFAVALPAAKADPNKAAETILQAIRRAGPEGAYGQRQLGASIGVAVVSGSNTTPAEVLARADDACYAAKSGGRNKWRLEADPSLASGLTSARLAADLTQAMSDGRLMLYGQEIRALQRPNTSTGRIEVLARLVSQQGQFIPPSEFIPAAERFGMAATLDRHIIGTALRDFGRWMGAEQAITLAFNLSAHSLSDPSLWDFVEATARHNRVALANIAFEITETAAITNLEAAERFLHKARERHCGVSLDDFGAGLSSFGYLRRFPVDSIKIDGSFIENIVGNTFDMEVVRSIGKIGQTLGIAVIAERIETPESLAILQDLRIEWGQGYLMHRPEPLEQLLLRLDPGGAAR